MKIHNINPISYAAKNSTTNFKGLWGKEEKRIVSSPFSDHAQLCDMGEDHTILTREYHPFLDESAEDIKKTIDSHTGIETDLAKDRNLIPSSPDAWVDCVDYIKEFKVKLMPRLEFSAAEFSAYKARELLSKAEMAVEDALKIAKLQKYLRK